MGRHGSGTLRPRRGEVARAGLGLCGEGASEVGGRLPYRSMIVAARHEGIGQDDAPRKGP